VEKVKIKPAARIISTMGEDLIKDMPAAIVELVKNSYDADASKVSVKFSCFTNKSSGRKNLRIKVSDNGHGMSMDKVLNSWMVPATSDKLERKYSPAGRPLQGRKGIGRYAASILGSILKLQTTDEHGETSRLTMDWDEIRRSKYLDEVEIEISSEITESESGTKMIIFGNNQKLMEWDEYNIRILIKELRKLLSPIKVHESNFEIELEFGDFWVSQYKNRKINISEFELLEMYDYRLYGIVNTQGRASLKYEQSIGNVIENIKDFTINLTDGAKYCGEIEIDFRVFDKDPEAIDALIERGVKSEDQSFLGKNEVKRLLKEVSGLSIYRGDFRIRPYGDVGYDWVELDRRRVQRPSLRIGSDQIAGFLRIQTEELSNLEEKSARDGLKENKYYQGLKQIVGAVLTILEGKRFNLRKSIGRGRGLDKVSVELNNLFDLSGLSVKLENKLISLNVNRDSIDELHNIIKTTEREKSKLLDNIKELIAIYQGQATLGKIIMVLLHEGRKPLSFFRNQTPILQAWAQQLKQDQEDNQLVDKIYERLITTREQASFLVGLFDKLDPLSIKKRGEKKLFKIKHAIHKSHQIFEGELKRNNINITINCNESIYLNGWEEDLIIIFSNLIENSIYWLSASRGHTPNIEISAFIDGEDITVDYIDNGPGISKEYIEVGSIYEPGFSTKPDGTGLGLAIAGEAITRNNGVLKALYKPTGAYFRLEFNK
jgi:signal transduction histidine kinase